MVARKLGVVLGTVALLGAGCGARLSHGQFLKAIGNGSQAAGGVAGGAAGDESVAAGDETGALGGGAAAGSTSGSGTGTASGSTSGPNTAPPGGNGGATDIGVTANSILLGNVSTLTGPVPGLFRGAVAGTQAFIAYQNSLGGVFGRQLKLKVGDDRLDSNENRIQVQNLIPQVFAFLGSFSVYDDAGADAMGKANIPDVGFALSHPRTFLKNNFSPQPLPPGYALGGLSWYQAHFPDAVKHVGALAVDVASAQDSWNGEKQAMAKLGFSITYQRKFEATETDFTADVVQMKNGRTSDGQPVKDFVMVADAASFSRVAKAMRDQDFKVDVASFAPNAYDNAFLQQAGAAAEYSPTFLYESQAMFNGEDAGTVPEVALFNTWLKRVAPGVNPDLFGAYGWASGRLFVQALQAAGPRATRAGLLAELGKIDNFDSNGLMAPAHPASKKPPGCYMIIQVQGGKFVRKEPASGFICDPNNYYLFL